MEYTLIILVAAVGAVLTYSTERVPVDCKVGNETYKTGESYPAGDGCNWCVCYNGFSGCTLMACLPPCIDVSSACFDYTCDEKISTYFYMDGGRTCPGCLTCLPDRTVPDMECPPIPCPVLGPPEDCTSPKLYSFYFDYQGRECHYCDIYICEDWL